MKAFNRDSLQQYKTIPRVNNNPYQSYYNPNTSAYAPVQQQQSFEGLLQGIPQGMMETYEDLMENTLPSEFRNLSQDQILQKLNEAYSYNQNDPLSEVKTTMDQRYNTIRNDLENQYQARARASARQNRQQRLQAYYVSQNSGSVAPAVDRNSPAYKALGERFQRASAAEVRAREIRGTVFTPEAQAASAAQAAALDGGWDHAELMSLPYIW